MFQVAIAIVTLSVALLFLAGKVNAQSEYELAQIVKQRTKTMHSMLDSYFPLLAIKNGKSSDLAVAAESAQSIKDGMISALSMFPEGTAQGEAIGSRAKPEIWSEPEDFKAAADTLVASLEKLASTANSDDIEAFKTEFASVEQACTACHAFKPSGGGKFRYPK